MRKSQAPEKAEVPDKAEKTEKAEEAEKAAEGGAWGSKLAVILEHLRFPPAS